MSKSALELVVQLKTLASEPNNRAHMCQGDHVLPPLVMWLDHPSSDVVFNALETIYFLSLYPPNRAQMVKNDFLMPKLKSLMSNGKTGDIKRKAIATFTSLKKAGGATAQQRSAENEPAAAAVPAAKDAPSAKDPLASASGNAAALGGTRHGGKAAPSFGFDAPATRQQANTVTVYMKELTTDARKTEFESKMVNHRGVVSFWVDLNQQKAVVRTTLTDEGLCGAIVAQLGWIASTEAAFVNPANDGYYNEEIGDGAVVHRTKQTKKARETQQQQSGGWFGGVASYLWG